MILTIYTDGASRGNPGASSYGFVITDQPGKIVYQEGKYIGMATNNIAEYTAVLKSLEYIKDKFSLKKMELRFFTDSRLVAEQLSGRFKIKSPNLRPLFWEIKKIESQIGQVSYSHVRREYNQQADNLANEALDKLPLRQF